MWLAVIYLSCLCVYSFLLWSPSRVFWDSVDISSSPCPFLTMLMSRTVHIFWHIFWLIIYPSHGHFSQWLLQMEIFTSFVNHCVSCVVLPFYMWNQVTHLFSACVHTVRRGWGGDSTESLKKLNCKSTSVCVCNNSCLTRGDGENISDNVS